MTTRITLSILLTTWAILIVGQTAAFLTARASLLSLLDHAMITRAMYVEPPSSDKIMSLQQGDEYRIDIDEAAAATATTVDDDPVQPRASLVDKGFETRADGRRARTVTLRTTVRSGGRWVPATIVYSRQTEPLDRLLSHLAVMLLLISLACGLTTAWLALKLSRHALRPLHNTADVIAGIDEQNLGRRIDVNAMPVELVPMTRRLNEMLQRLQNVFQQRKQFLADAAHELRTPTAALLTTLEVALRRPRDQAALIESMNSGLADARRLRKLVEQLMEHARSEHLRGPESMQVADVPGMLRECVQIVTPLAKEKNISIEQELPAEASFVTQRERFRSIVLNLLSNAIEYNREGGTIRLAAERQDGELRLTVQDTGHGIAAEQLPQVFEPFYRGGNGRGDDPDHLGLGLFLVRSHVDAMHGKCEIESTVGVGTTVAITLPEPNGPAAGTATATVAPTGTAVKGSATAPA